MEKLLLEIIEKNKPLIERGKLADYIPALSQVDPEKIGISLVDMDGIVYSAGDWDHKFTIQSISKVLSLMLAIRDNGEERVFEKIGYEGTDEAFNSLFKLDLGEEKKPANPMINAGAILTTSLIKEEDGKDRFSKILEFYKKVTGNDSLDYNREIFQSEKLTGDKNRAMAYLMKANGSLEGDVESILDAYFKQCSIEVNSMDLARIGLYIADRENNKEDNELKRIVTAIMSVSGMYNFSGEYARQVGIASKSGVGGGIMASLTGKMGIGVYSPVLDKNGNSLAGYGMIKDISEKLNLSIY